MEYTSLRVCQGLVCIGHVDFFFFHIGYPNSNAISGGILALMCISTVQEELCVAIMEAYVGDLIENHQVALVAAYVAVLPQNLQVEWYAKFLEGQFQQY